MKKTIMFVSIFAVAFALTASATLAATSDITVDVKNTNFKTLVVNKVKAISNTGRNFISNYCCYGGGCSVAKIHTGEAVSVNDVANAVNTSETIVNARGCGGCSGDIDVDVENDNKFTAVVNKVKAISNSGKNTIVGGGWHAPKVITTSDAVSSNSVFNLVNSQVTKVIK